MCEYDQFIGKESIFSAGKKKENSLWKVFKMDVL